MARTPIQDKLICALKKARTTEPYPVWVSWVALSRLVYGYWDDRSILNLRRAAEKMRAIELLRFDNGRHAGPCFSLTFEEAWLKRWTLRVTGRGNYSADSSDYQPPNKDELLAAFKYGLAQRHTGRVNVSKLTVLINEHCDTEFDPSETAWSVVGYQNNWEANRRELLLRSVNAFESLRTRTEVIEAERRKVTVGPFRIDPQSLEHCPCCQQPVAGGSQLPFWGKSTSALLANT